jgi:hypothetical protein
VARRLEEFPQPVDPRFTHPYDWEAWEDGEIWKLRQGEDFPMSKETDRMRSQVFNRARRRGRMVTTQKVIDLDGVEALVFRFFDE